MNKWIDLLMHGFFLVCVFLMIAAIVFTAVQAVLTGRF